MQLQVHPRTTTTTLYLSRGPPAAAESQQSLQPPQYAQQPPSPLVEPVRLVPNRRAPSPMRYSRNNETGGAKTRQLADVYRFNNPALQTSKLRPSFRTPTGTLGEFFFCFFFGLDELD